MRGEGVQADMKLIVAILLLIAGCSDASGATTTAVPDAGERITIFTHCGFYETVFDGQTWTPASIGRGDFPDGTDPMATPGSIRRVGEQALFTADSGLEVWFDPAPDDLPPPPPCD